MVVVRLFQGSLINVWQTQAGLISIVLLLLFLAGVVIWGVLDGRADAAANPDPDRRSDLAMTWLLAGLVAGVVSGAVTWLIGVFYKALYVGGLINELTVFAAFTALLVFLGGISGVALGRFLIDRAGAYTPQRAAAVRRTGPTPTCSPPSARMRPPPEVARGRRSSRRRWQPPSARTTAPRRPQRRRRRDGRGRQPGPQRGKDRKDSLAAAAECGSHRGDPDPRNGGGHRGSPDQGRHRARPNGTKTSGRRWPDTAGPADSPARRARRSPRSQSGSSKSGAETLRAHTHWRCAPRSGARVSSVQASRSATDVCVSPPALRITGSPPSAARWIQSSS